MKVVQINNTCGTGSIGKICQAISQLLSADGIENYILYSQGKSDYPLAKNYCNEELRKSQSLCEKLFGLSGFCAPFTTSRLIKELKKLNPDIVHLHNLHSHDCDIKLLFKYLKETNIKVFYTFHDCWAITGYCTHFMMEKCNKWKEQCFNCPKYKNYSYFFDRSEELFIRKKEAFVDANLTVITPSKWLGNITKQSFLKDHEVRVINNGIDLNTFKPTPSEFRKEHKCEDKILLLGIANGWPVGKNIDAFLRLAKELNDKFKIILIGTNDDIDRFLPDNVISIHRTNSQIQLAEIYTTVDVLINPTLEDNFPTVNIEALACGTPVVTYNTGGSVEMLDDSCGKSIERGDIESLISYIKEMEFRIPFNSTACRIRAEKYSDTVCFSNYLKLYRENLNIISKI